MNLHTFLCFLTMVEVNSFHVIFENVTCESLDTSFFDFRHCSFETISAGVKALNIHGELYQFPVKDITANAAFFKYDKGKGYQPYFYNFTWDFCAFMKNRKRMPAVKGIADVLTKLSNINHTCPYSHDIIVQNWVLRQEYFTLFPLPVGSYLIRVKVAVYDDWKSEFKTFVKFI